MRRKDEQREKKQKKKKMEIFCRERATGSKRERRVGA